MSYRHYADDIATDDRGRKPIIYNMTLQCDCLPSGRPSKRFGYYCEVPRSKGGMVRDLFFNLTAKSLALGKNPEKENEELSAFSVEAEFSYFYGRENNPEAYRDNRYKRYEWKGHCFCAKHATEAEKQAVEKYNRWHVGRHSVLIDERLSNEEFSSAIGSLSNFIKLFVNNDADRLREMVFDTLDSLKLRSYESERRVKRHRYNKIGIGLKWEEDINRNANSCWNGIVNVHDII